MALIETPSPLVDITHLAWKAVSGPGEAQDQLHHPRIITQTHYQAEDGANATYTLYNTAQGYLATWERPPHKQDQIFSREPNTTATKVVYALPATDPEGKGFQSVDPNNQQQIAQILNSLQAIYGFDLPTAISNSANGRRPTKPVFTTSTAQHSQHVQLELRIPPTPGPEIHIG